LQYRRYRGTPPVCRGEGTNFLGPSRPERVCGPGYVAFVVTFSRPALNGGTEESFCHCLSHCQRPWLFRDGFCQCVHTDINPQIHIFAIYTVADPQTLYQRNLPVFRCAFLITTVQSSRIKFQWFIILNRINTDFRILPYYHFIFNKYSP